MFLISLANTLLRLASTTAFLCLVVAHLEWPLMNAPRPFSLTCSRTHLARRAPWTRRSPVISGWNEVAISAPCRTATILPAAGALGHGREHLDGSPTCSTHGARMKTAWTGPVVRGGRSPGRSRRSRPGGRRRCAGPSCRCRRASPGPGGRPRSGRPAGSCPRRTRTPGGRPPAPSRSGSRTPKARASLSIVVDSPPGSTMPARPVSSSGAADRARLAHRSPRGRGGARGRRPGARGRR